MGRCEPHWATFYVSVHQAEARDVVLLVPGAGGGGAERGRGTDREMWGRGQPGSLCGMRGQGEGRGQRAVSTVTGVRGVGCWPLPQGEYRGRDTV